MSAVLVSAAGAIQSYGGTATPIAKPANPQLGDVLVISFLMNGAPTLPTGWTVKYSGDNANVVVYARVDGTNITAANDGQTFAFGDGGGASYFSHVIGLIRGAVAAGDPFDGVMTANASAGSASPLLAKTTTVDDGLLIYAAHVLFGAVSVTAATSPLVVANNVSNFAHMASGVQAVAGASGNKQFTYDAATAYNVAQLGSILPFVEPPVPGNGLTAGGRERFTARRTPKNRRRSR